MIVNDVRSSSLPAASIAEFPRPRRRISSHGLFLAVAGGSLSVVLFVLWMVFGWGGGTVTTAVDDLAQALAAFVGTAGCVYAAVTRRHDRGAWGLLGAACFSWGAGELVWSYNDVIAGIHLPFPSYADIGFSAELALAVTAMLLFRTVRLAGLSRSRIALDAAMVAGALLSVSLATVMSMQESGTVLARSLSRIYLGGDVMLVTLALFLMMRAPSRARSVYGLIGLGVVCLGVSDSLFAYLTGTGAYDTASDLVSTGWVAGFLLIGVAGLTAKGIHRESSRIPGYFEMMLPFVGIAVAGVVSIAVGSGNPPALWTARVAIALGFVRLFMTSLENLRQVRSLVAQARILNAHFAEHPEPPG